MSKSVPVFLAYRRADGESLARCAYLALNGKGIPAIDGDESCTVEVFCDLFNPPNANFSDRNGPALRSAQSLVLIVTPGAFARTGPDDWLYREIDWWLENRPGVPPIVLNAVPAEKDRWIPGPIKGKWPGLNWLPFSEHESENSRTTVFPLVLIGIAGRIPDWLQSELERERAARNHSQRQARVLKSWVLTAAILVFVALITAMFWYLEFKRAEEQTTIANNKSSIAEASSRIARERELEADRRRMLTVAQALAAQSQVAVRDENVELAALLARQAYLIHERAQGEVLGQIDDSLRSSLSRTFNSIVTPAGSIPISVAFHPDATTLACGCADRSLWFWDLAIRGMASKKFQLQHSSALLGIAFGADGKELFVAFQDGTIAVVDHVKQDVIEHRKLSQFTQGEHAYQAALSVAFSPDRKRVSYGFHGRHHGSVRIWNLERPYEAPQELHKHLGMSSVAFGVDAAQFASTGNGDLRRWNLSQAVPESETLDKLGYGTLSFSPDGKMLAATANLLRIWQVDPAALAFEKKLETKGSGPIAFAPDGNSIACAGDEGVVLLYPIVRPPASSFRVDVPRQLCGHRADLTALQFDSRGKTLVSASRDGTLRIWDLETPYMPQKSRLAAKTTANEVEAIYSVQDNAGSVTIRAYGETNVLEGIQLSPYFSPGYSSRVLKISPDLRWVAIGGADGRIRLWDWRARGQDVKVTATVDGTIDWVEFAADSKTLICRTSRGVAVFDVPSALPKGPYARDGVIKSVLISQTGNALVCKRDTGNTLWSLDRPESPPAELGTLAVFAFSPDGCVLALGGADGSVGQIAIDDQNVQSTRHGMNAKVVAINWSEDNQRFACGDSDGNVAVWEREPAESLPRIMRGHEKPITALCFTSDGHTLASGSADSTVRIWNIARPKAIPILLHIRGSANNLTFDSERKTLVVESTDPTAKDRSRYQNISQEFVAETGALADTVCRIARRNLTPQEWARFLGDDIPYEPTCEAGIDDRVEKDELARPNAMH